MLHGFSIFKRKSRRRRRFTEEQKSVKGDGRLLTLGSVLALTAFCLIGRGVHLHFAKADFLKNEGDIRSIRTKVISANRGIISDRYGNPLAVSSEVVSIYCNPLIMNLDPTKIRKLADYLKMPPEPLLAKLQSAKERKRRYLRLKRHLQPELGNEIAALDIHGLSREKEYKRYYPTGEVAAHIVGFTNKDHQGQEGIELAFDSLLQGRSGSTKMLNDRHGKMIKQLDISLPKPGEDLRLTIDLRLQYAAYKALKKAVKAADAKAGSIVALDARTGELLALVNEPTFNPNNRSHFSHAAARNRAITDVFEPGSTIKPFTVIAALDSGWYGPQTLVDTTPGEIRVSGHRISDTINYGVIDVTRIITKSSNIGAAKLAMSLPMNALPSWFDRFGFGEATGVGLPGERKGTLKFFERPRRLETATLSYGYGLDVTAIQLAQAYGVLAADGIKRPLSIAKNSQHYAEDRDQRVIGRGLAQEVNKMLMTVTESEGTATAARIPGYTVAGKTGTVHKLENGQYNRKKYGSLFAGFVPATRPEIVMVVVIDEPQGAYYGGKVAAPAFSAAGGDMLRLLGIASDKQYADLVFDPLMAAYY